MCVQRKEDSSITLQLHGLFSGVLIDNYVTLQLQLQFFRQVVGITLQLQFQFLFTRNWNCNSCGQDCTKRPENEMRREPQDSSIPVPRFQSGGGLLNHTGGTYSHGGMIDYPRFPISEMHLGNVPDSTEFQSWKVNFKTGVCAKPANPHLTVHWIKEVEIAESIDQLMTSRSIVARNDFPDYDMLDAMIASALKKLLNTHIHFRKGVSVEEQRAQKSDRFSQG